MKPKSFCLAKETNDRVKRQPVEWKKIFSNHISNEELIPKIHKELLNLIAKKGKKTG